MKHSVHLIGLDAALTACVQDLQNDLPYALSDKGTPVRVTKGDKLSITRSGSELLLTYHCLPAFFRALSLLKGILDGKESVTETNRYSLLCYMADMSRNAVYNIKTAKQMIRYLALMGYNSMMLYTEDTFELPGHPYFGHMRGRFTTAELKELDDYAYAFGIELIPCVQTLAHLTTALRWPEFSGYKDTSDILMVGDERTYAFVEDTVKQCVSCFRSRRIHIGMDEAHMLGRGDYLLRNGYRKASDIMLEHLHKVLEICKKYDCKPMMWSDMFFRMAFDGAYYKKEGEIPAEVVAKYPTDVELVYWDYYNGDDETLNHMFECHKKFNAPVIFAGGAWKWSGFAPHNKFSLEVTAPELDACERYGVDQIIVTAWGDNGAEASQFSVLSSMLYYAERAYAAELSDEWLETRAQQCFGIGFAELLAFDLPNELPGLPTEGRKTQNPSKYLLYNDLLERFMDLHFDPATAPATFAAHAEKLASLAAHPTLGYAYDTLSKLCRVLAIKTNLGTRLYEAYGNGDKTTLKQIATDDIPATIKALEEFLATYRVQWYRENKSFGFIAQELRIGGLLTRLASVKETLLSYLDGSLEKIEELEYAPLPMKRHRTEVNNASPYISFNNWYENSIAGLM